MAVCSKYVEFVLRGKDLTTNKPIVNVYHYLNQNVGPFVTTQAGFIAAWFAANLGAMLACVSIKFTMVSVTCRNLDNPLDAGETVPDANLGTYAGDALPLFNAITFPCKTATRGRSYKGSKHLGPVSEDATTEDLLNAGAIVIATAFATLLKAPLTPVAGETWKLAIYSPTVTNSPANPTPGLPVLTVVNDVTVNASVGTMKRRKVKL